MILSALQHRACIFLSRGHRNIQQWREIFASLVVFSSRVVRFHNWETSYVFVNSLSNRFRYFNMLGVLPTTIERRTH